ncbi:MAG: FmdB family zinc ribbon protein [Leucothrix sp.]
MPIYEYQCVECEHIEEVIQKVSDDPLSICPSCHKPALKKKVTAAGFRLSGGGWYETDFKSGDKKNLTDGGPDKTKNTDKSAAKTEKATDKKASSSTEAS